MYNGSSTRHPIIVTRTPLRLSFAGGGTDLPVYYEQGFGAVLNMAIDKYIYVTVKRHSDLYGHRYRLNYSESEEVNTVAEIKNDIARECLNLVPVEAPLYISTVGDLPAQAGLGSSSSFAVGLLHALHAMRGERLTPGQLADEAITVEIDRLRRPIGKQDQIVAAFGGLNYIRFEADGRVQIEPQKVLHERIEKILSWSMMMWTGIQRDANSILKEQKENSLRNTEALDFIRNQASEMRDLIVNGSSIQELGELLDAGWSQKRNLSSKISTDRIDGWYADAKAAGAIGGKLCGAGGGGYLLLIAPPNKQRMVIKALSGLPQIKLQLEPHGSRVLLPSLI